MRVMGLDFGTRRIGVALSDPDGVIASPLVSLVRHGARRDVAALRELAREHEVGEIVVGLPVHLDGRRGPEAEAARAFARQVAESTGLPVDTFDERWTTVQAERALRESGRRGRKRREVVDAVAASILLSAWLERRRARRERAG